MSAELQRREKQFMNRLPKALNAEQRLWILEQWARPKQKALPDIEYEDFIKRLEQHLLELGFPFTTDKRPSKTSFEKAIVLYNKGVYTPR